ncbi:hypothetical protein BABINDRAFT_162704 [Babjeviella inositovora NRRL Y-12698]|uniref:SWI5-dependent HO expression protein 4 n=1 Tax=Babjeviella inositovora NRRL Y-12698 TaxID=984486 RepID=A0A1E3QLC2_9ASCO|nr:uncharacterized protein BABINDRAFT_162704 [Babjeviella inositovora NRRL Y-12698]ODQ78496.1 hypothetical protein BABINDRAFT_162704 [Babjeviella inositovora NRRL Y-12698]
MSDSRSSKVEDYLRALSPLFTSALPCATDEYGLYIPNLDALSVALRDPDSREAPLLKDRLPSLVQIINEIMSSSLPDSTTHEGILVSLFKVLINLTADNSLNSNLAFQGQREFLWKNISSNLQNYSALNSILVVAVANAIRISQSASEEECPLSWNCDDLMEVFSPLIVYTYRKYQEMDVTIEDLASELESIHHLSTRLSNVTLSLSVDDELMSMADVLLKGIDQANVREGKFIVDDEVLSESLQHVATAIYTISAYEALHSMHPARTLSVQTTLIEACRKLSLIDADRLENATLINRLVFAAIGLVSSLPTNTNEPELPLAVNEIINADGIATPYSASAACIILGNYITSREKQASFLNATLGANKNAFMDALPRRFGEFNDVVQYQALHLMQFLIEDEILLAKIFEHNWQSFVKATKIVSDNRQYYQSIASQLLAVLTKLVPCIDNVSWVEAFVTDVFNASIHSLVTDDAFSTESVNLEQALLSKTIGLQAAQTPFSADLIVTTHALINEVLQLPDTGTISSSVIMAKIKSVAEVLHTDASLLLTHASLALFLEKLYVNMLVEENPVSSDLLPPEKKALYNNSKFIAAKVLQHVTAVESETDDTRDFEALKAAASLVLRL